jgi:hypothetical protein
MLVWTLGSGGNGGPGEYMEWIYELTSVLGNPEMRTRWINFLNSNKTTMHPLHYLEGTSTMPSLYYCLT